MSWSEISFFSGTKETVTPQSQTNVVVQHYQKKVQKEISKYSEIALKRVPEQKQPEIVGYSFKTAVQLTKEFNNASSKCTQIVLLLMQDLSSLKTQRKNLSWIEKKLFDETLVKARLGLLKTIVKDLSAYSVTSWTMPKFKKILSILEEALASNKKLTNDYNTGILINEVPFFKAGDGILHKLIEDTSKGLSAHKELFKKYFAKMSVEQPLTSLVNDADEAFEDVKRWGNNLFGNN